MVEAERQPVVLRILIVEDTPERQGWLQQLYRDHAWVLVRRAAGYDQRKGIIGPVFATTVVVGTVCFTIWLVFIAGLGPSLAPRS